MAAEQSPNGGGFLSKSNSLNYDTELFFWQLYRNARKQHFEIFYWEICSDTLSIFKFLFSFIENIQCSSARYVFYKRRFNYDSTLF